MEISGAELMQHHKQLKNYAYKLTRDRDKAEDLIQDTFCSAISYARKGHFDGVNLGAWLSRIMRNRWISLIRAEQTRRRNGGDVDVEDAARFAGIPAQQEDGLLQASFKAAVETLIPVYLSAFNAIVAEGMSYEEAALHLGSPVNTIKVRVFRAKKIITEFIENGSNAGNVVPFRKRRSASNGAHVLGGAATQYGPLPGIAVVASRP